MNATFTPSQTANTTSIRDAFDVCVAKTRANISDLNTRPTTWAIGFDGDYTKWNEGFFEIGDHVPELGGALEVEFGGDPLDVGFNVTYLLDVLSNVPPGKPSAKGYSWRHV